MTGEDLSAQVAVLAARQADDRERGDDHEQRLRMVETAVVALQALPRIAADLESRQGVNDQRFRYALPIALVAAVASGASELGDALVTLIAWLGKG